MFLKYSLKCFAFNLCLKFGKIKAVSIKAQQFIFCKPYAKIVISSTTPCHQLDFLNWIHLHIDDFWSMHEKLEINCCLVFVYSLCEYGPLAQQRGLLCFLPKLRKAVVEGL